MAWIKPDFEEIVLGMEVTGYVNTDTNEVFPLENARAAGDAAVTAQTPEPAVP